MEWLYMAILEDPEFEHNVVQQVNAIVLGGGRGTRLYPLTKVRCKPAVPLCGRYRLIDIPLSNCIHSGIDRISVLTQFNSHSLNRHISSTYVFDDFSQGYVALLAAEQTNETGDWFQGTADAVRKHLLHIRHGNPRYYVILSGDQLYRMDYRTLLATHIRKGSDITVAALPVTRDAAQSFGVMQVAQNGRIRRFVEKPKDPAVLDTLMTPPEAFKEFKLNTEGKPCLASMGIYVFNAGVLEELLLNNPGWLDFGKELIPGALKSHKLYAHLFSGFWEDIGTVRSYFDVSMEITSPNPPFRFHDPHHMIYTRARALPGVILRDTHATHAIICEGSRIGKAEISHAIIGIRSIVNNDVTIENSIILGADYFETETTLDRKHPIGIGAHSIIRHAIIDHNARIGKHVVIHGSQKLKETEGEGYSIRGGIVVVHKDAIIPDGTHIG